MNLCRQGGSETVTKSAFERAAYSHPHSVLQEASLPTGWLRDRWNTPVATFLMYLLSYASVGGSVCDDDDVDDTGGGA